jgi:AcrR family transcriptional regulator
MPGWSAPFAKHGFAEPNIETLRKATGVSLRTLYKYVPSRDVMILRALEHRHRRYMAHVFSASHCNSLAVSYPHQKQFYLSQL